MPRLALRALDPARLELTRDWFTSRGGRLVCDFEVSDGWQPMLPDLVVPRPRDVCAVVGPLPGQLPADDVAMLALVPRTRAFTVLTAVLDRALFRVLREEAGLAYAPSATYRPVDSRQGVVLLATDSVGQDAIVLVRDELRAVAEDGPDPDDLAQVLDEMRAAYERDDLGAVVGSVVRELNGLPPEDEPTADDVARAADHMLGEALYLGPWHSGEVPLLQPTSQYVTGLSRRHRSVDAPRDRTRLELRDGVLWQAQPQGDSTKPITAIGFRLDQVTACFEHPEGVITLVDIEGRSFSLDPEQWHEGTVLREAVLAGLPRQVRAPGWRLDATELAQARTRRPLARRLFTREAARPLSPVPAHLSGAGVTWGTTALFALVALIALAALVGAFLVPVLMRWRDLPLIPVLGMVAVMALLVRGGLYVAMLPVKRAWARLSQEEMGRGPAWRP